MLAEFNQFQCTSEELVNKNEVVAVVKTLMMLSQEQDGDDEEAFFLGYSQKGRQPSEEQPASGANPI